VSACVAYFLFAFLFSTTNIFIPELYLVLSSYAELLDLDACLSETETVA
jgi:hypothetical protein